MNDRRRAYALATLTAAYFVMGTTTMAAIGALPSIADGLHVSRGAVANLISVFALTYAVGAPLIQMVLGFLERRALLLGGLSLAALGALLAAAAPNYGVLFAARVLTALGAAAIGPVASALGAGLVERHQQGRALAAVFMGMTISSVLSMPASAWISLNIGWRPLFVTVAGLNLGVIAAVLVFVKVREAGQRMALRELVGLLRQPAIASGVSVVFLQMAGLFASYTLIVPLLRERFGLSGGEASSALLVFGVASVVGNVAARWVATRWSAERSLAVALGVLVGTFALAYVAPGVSAVAFVVLILWAVANDVFVPAQQRRLVELAPHARGVVLALNASALYIGMSAGSAVAGRVYSAAGAHALPLASMLLLLAALGMLQLSRRPARPARAAACLNAD